MARAHLRVALLTPILKSQAEHYVPVQPELPAKANLGKPMFDDLATLEQLRVGAASCELSAGFDEAQDEPRNLGITPRLECKVQAVHSGPLLFGEDAVPRSQREIGAARPMQCLARTLQRGIEVFDCRLHARRSPVPLKTTSLVSSRILPHDDFTLFCAACRRCLSGAEFAAVVDECWRVAFERKRLDGCGWPPR